MKPLTMEELQELRADIAALRLPEDRVDELIRLIDNIIISIIDQNSGRHSVQLSLSARANYAFNPDGTYASLRKSESFELVDLPGNERGEGANNEHNPMRDFAPR